jgi:hypothetical protein
MPVGLPGAAVATEAAATATAAGVMEVDSAAWAVQLVGLAEMAERVKEGALVVAMGLV